MLIRYLKVSWKWKKNENILEWTLSKSPQHWGWVRDGLEVVCRTGLVPVFVENRRDKRRFYADVLKTVNALFSSNVSEKQNLKKECFRQGLCTGSWWLLSLSSLSLSLSHTHHTHIHTISLSLTLSYIYKHTHTLRTNTISLSLSKILYAHASSSLICLSLSLWPSLSISLSLPLHM